MKKKILFLLFIHLIFVCNIHAQQKIKFLNGNVIHCRVYEVCNNGVKYKMDSVCYFAKWPAIIFIKYKDGSKVRPGKSKDFVPSDTVNAVQVIHSPQKNDSTKKIIAPILVAGKIIKDTLSDSLLHLECRDADFDKGYQDADKHYKGKGVGLLTAGSTFVFLPVGFTLRLILKHTKPLVKKNEIADQSLRKNSIYMRGYRLRAAAKRDMKLIRGFWIGFVALVAAETGLYEYQKDHPNSGGSGGGGGYHHH